MIETFTKEKFENNLPINNVTKQAMWQSLGLIDGEFVYTLPINSSATILIRSSVKQSGYSAETGKDSIRIWLVDPITNQPVGSKISSYITRVFGWEIRLVTQLRMMYKLGKKVHACECGKGPVRVLKVKKEGPNQGKFFTACSDFKCEFNPFTFLPSEFQPKKFQVN